MGQKISDGKAFDAAAPGSTVINDGDLYRIGKWNGVAVGGKDATQADRTMSFEMDPAAIYSIKLPAITPAVGDFLYWANPAIFQKGDTHLQATPHVDGDSPAFEVIATKNAAGYAQGRVINGGGGALGTGESGVVSQVAPTALTDNSGGVAADGTIGVVDTTPHAADAVKELATKVNELITKLTTAGVFH